MIATCRDCISFSRCKELYEAFGVSIDLENSVVCKHFKNQADFMEVAHGRWIRHKENCLYNKCSICCYEHCRENNYCPNCGADMRGENDG